MLKKLRGKITYTRVIALGFAGIILLGAFLLMLPVSSRSGEWTPFVNSLFTSTSATCVTGLVVYDTYSHWSVYGQLVIMMLIQIGGLGFMTVITQFSIFLRRRIGLHERHLLMQSAGTMRLSGVVVLIKRIVKGTVMFEVLGAIVLATRFCPQMGFWQGLYNAVFHSISAFCNAGFDLMGKYGKFSSFTTFSDDYVVNITLCFLIVVGGVGFLVWNNLIIAHGKKSKLELHTKLVLFTTAILLTVGAVLFYATERDHSLAGMSLPQSIMASVFQSVSPRTAGFNTVDLSSMSEPGSFVMTILMLIGGSPGSTAGGIKTTTVAVLVLGAVAAARHNPHIIVFKRRLDDSVLMQASSIAFIYLAATCVCTLLLCTIESIDFERSLFEVVSAVGTVGLTKGITSTLGTVSKFILMFLMFAGRVGGLSLALVLAEKREKPPMTRPVEKILIG